MTDAPTEKKPRTRAPKPRPDLVAETPEPVPPSPPYPPVPDEPSPPPVDDGPVPVEPAVLHRETIVGQGNTEPVPPGEYPGAGTFGYPTGES